MAGDDNADITKTTITILQLMKWGYMRWFCISSGQIYPLNFAGANIERVSLKTKEMAITLNYLF